MQRLIALLSSNLCTVLMLVLLMFLALPLAFAQPLHESPSSLQVLQLDAQGKPTGVYITL